MTWWLKRNVPRLASVVCMAALAGCGLSGVAALVVDGPRAVVNGVELIVRAIEGVKGSGKGDGGDGAGGGRYKTAPTIDDTIFNLSEGATAIGTVTATDEGGIARSYSLEDGTQAYEAPDGVKFNIDAETGEITSTTPLDYESSTSYSFVVVATDLGGNTNTATPTPQQSPSI